MFKAVQKRGRRNIMKKGFSITKKITIALLSSLIVLLTNCDSWMKSDDFFGIIDEEVKYANAEKINVFVRYANTKEGSTNINGNSTQKVEVPFTVSAVTNDAYGFYKWAAFSTSDYSTGRQHAILFNDDADYIDSYLGKEISSSIVSFADPYSPETTVTINSSRNDVFIMPIVAERPMIATSLPASGASNVVKNMGIRVVFSKPMEPTSLLTTDESGKTILTDQIEVFRTYGTFDNLSLVSIKDKFTNVSLGATGKTLTIRLPQGESMTTNTTIRVVVGGEVKDSYGYEMGSEQYIQFTTGTASDSLAPVIDSVYAGFKTADDWGYNQNQDSESNAYRVQSNNFNDYGENDEDSISAKLLKHRTSGIVNLWVYAADITETSSQPTEADVYQLTIRGTSITDNEGNESSHEKSEELLIQYESGGNSSSIAAHESAYGCQFEYDVSSLPDGIIRIDIGAADTIGNDNFSPECVMTDKGNYYKSVYIVKDSTKPDIESNAGKVKSDSAAAPYGWYNAETVNTMEIYVNDDELITDIGNEKLVSLPDDIKWIFSVNSTSAWNPDESDPKWKIIKGNRYKITDATSNTDGAMDIKMRLMDDVGNISDEYKLDSIMYDGTKPVVNGLSWTGSSGELSGITQNITLTTQTLSMEFTEETSGVKFLELSSKKSGTAVSANPLAGVTLKIDGRTLSEGSDYTNDGKKITFAESHSSGTLTIDGIKLTDATANTDGIYTIGVDLTDLALNKTAETKTINISLDKTNPEIEKVEVKDLVERIVYGETESSYFIPKASFDSSRTPNKNEISVTVKENGSGINKIALGGNAKVTGATTVRIGDTDCLAADFTVDTDSNTVTMTNGFEPLIWTETGTITFTLTNIEFTNVDNSSGNSLSVTLTDFVKLEGDNGGEITLDDGSKIEKVYADSKDPSFEKVTIQDRKQNSEENSVVSAYEKEKFTDERLVTLIAKINAESANAGSGTKSIKLTNATFTAGTTAQVDGSDFTGFSVDGDTITFEKTFTSACTLTFTNVQITSTANGTHEIGATATDLVGWSADEKNSNEIIYDNVKPEIGTIKWTVTTSDAIAGVTKEATLSTQVLNIPFTEATAGAKKISITAERAGESAVEEPFSSASLEVKFGSSTITNGSGYTIPADEPTSIVFTEPLKTGVLTIRNLTISDTADEGIYTLTVKILDAAENTNTTPDSTIQISMDSTKPVVEKVQVANLRKRVLYSDGSESYWLGKENHENTLGNSPSYAKMDIYLEETYSGVQKITLGSCTLLQTSTKIYIDDSSTALSSSEYTIDTNANTITFLTSPAMATTEKPIVVRKDSGTTKITLDGIKFRTYSTNTSSGGDLSYAKNTFSVVAQDFALNESVEKTSILLDDEVSGSTGKSVTEVYSHIYADYMYSLTLVDRGSDNGTDTNALKAADGFTNERQINAEFVHEEKSATLPGVNKVTVTGATFTDDTTVAVKFNGASSYTTLSEGSDYTFEDSTTCVFKKTFDSNKAYSLKFKDISLSGSANAVNTVALQAYSVTELYDTSNGKKSASITFDNEKPAWESTSGLFTSYCTTYAYNTGDSSINVYPHSSSSSSKPYGRVIDESDKNKDNLTHRYFYTSAKKDSSTYAAALTVSAKDNISLSGATNHDGFYYYYYKHGSGDTISSIGADEVVKKTGTVRQDSITSGDSSSAPTYTGSKTSCAYKGFFEAGATYTVVITDDAGNYSTAQTFTLVKDDKIIDKLTEGTTASDSGTVDLETGFEYTVGKAGYQIVSYNYDLQYRNVYPRLDDVGVETSDTANRVAVKLNLAGDYSYSERTPTKTQSGIFAYMLHSSSTAPNAASSATGSATSFGYWIAFDGDSSSEITVYLPFTSSGSLYYLALQDNTGNVYNMPIRSKENKSYGKYEYWISSEETIKSFYTDDLSKNEWGLYDSFSTDPGHYTGVGSFTGDPDYVGSRNAKDGVMVTTAEKIIYNDNAKLSVSVKINTASCDTTDLSSEGIIRSGASKGERTPCAKVALVAGTSAPTKDEVDAMTEDATDEDKKITWTYVDRNSSGQFITCYDYGNGGDYRIAYPKNANSNNIYLVIEDYTGRYGCYQLTATHLDQSASTPSTVYKWLYDNEAPAIYLKDTTKEPSTLKTEEELNALISQAGKRVYVYDGTAYLSNKIDSVGGDVVTGGSYTYTTGMGTNTFRSIGTSADAYGGINYSSLRPYFNIDVDEKDEIAGYCYTYGTATPPDLSSTSTDRTICNTTAREGRWYTGDFISTGVSALIDTTEISISTIYLHVKDRVGNVRTMKMGDLKYQRTEESPRQTNNAECVYEEGEYYLEDTGTAKKLYIAGTSETYTSHGDLKIKVPTSWYTPRITTGTDLPHATDESAMYGYSYGYYYSSTEDSSNTNGKGNIKTVSTETDDDGNPLLVIPYSKYSAFGSTESNVVFYAYDKVGNFCTETIKAVVDSEAPSIQTNITATKAFDHTVSGSGTGYTYTSNEYTTGGTSDLYTSETQIAAAAKTVYFSTTSPGSITIKTTDTDSNSASVRKWTGSSWEVVTDYMNTPSSWSQSSDKKSYTAPASAFGTLTADGTYFCLSIADYCGNRKSMYFKFVYDNTKPSIEVTNVEKVNTIEDSSGEKVNYFGANATIKVKYSDNGTGLYKYDGKNSSGAKTTLTNSYSDTMNEKDVEFYIKNLSSSTSANQITLTASDYFSLTTTETITNSDSDEWVYDNTKPTLGTPTVEAKGSWGANAKTDPSGSNKYTVTYGTAAKKLQITLDATDTTGILGWIKTDSPEEFYSADTVFDDVPKNSSGNYVYTEDLTSLKVSSKGTDPQGSVSFCAVDYAGNVSEVITLEYVYDATEAKFENMEYSGIAANGDVNYFNSESTVTATMDKPITAYYITNGKIYEGQEAEQKVYKYKEKILTGSYKAEIKLDDESFENCSESPLYILAYYLWKMSDNYSLTGVSGTNKWSYDGTAPAGIAITNATDQNGANSYVIFDSENAKIKYGANATKAIISLSATDDGAGVLGYSTTKNGTFTDTLEIDLTTSPTSVTVYASDKIGNVSSEGLEITLEKDDSVSAISVAAQENAGTYINGTTVFFKETASLKATCPDSDITKFICEGTSNTESTDGTFSLAEEGSYTFKAVDELGNESAGVTLTLTKDTESPTIALQSVSPDDSSEYVYKDGNGVYHYNPSGVPTFTLTLAPADSGSGFKEITTSTGATSNGGNVTLTSPEGEISVTASDNVGNVSGAVKITFQKDETAPAIGTYTGSGELTPAYDSTVGINYISNVVESGYALTIPVTEAVGTSVNYGFIISESGTAPDASGVSEWTEASLTDGSATITFQLPTITEVHKHVFFYVKDSVENVGSVMLGDPANTGHTWWITKASGASGATITKTAIMTEVEDVDAEGNKTTSEYQSGTRLTISGLSVQNPITTISAAGATSATVTSMEISGTAYQSMPAVTVSDGVIRFSTPYIATKIVVETDITDSTSLVPAVTGIAGNVSATAISSGKIGTADGIATITEYFRTSSGKVKSTRKVSAESILSERYAKKMKPIVSESEETTTEKAAAAIKNETVEAESGNEERTVDFSDYREEISRHIFAKAVSTGGKKISKAVQKKVEKRIEKEIDGIIEIIKEEPKNSTSEKTMETVQKERKESLSAVQIQIAKIVLAMVLATVIVGIVFAIKKNGKPRNEN